MLSWIKLRSYWSNCFPLFLFVVIFCPNAISGQQVFVKGADGSVLDQVEQSGGIFYDQGEEADAYTIFKKYGFNNIRLKLWHTPELPYNGLERVKMMAKRATAEGMSLTLDFHYSDTWADPGNQLKPAAWEDAQFAALTDSIRNYTRNVIHQLRMQNTLPEYVQIGNEITCGMLWNDGRVCDPWNTDTQWNKLGILIKNAIQGLNEALLPEDEVKVIIHFDNGGNNSACRWFFDNIEEENIDFDIIGLSFYPWWHGDLDDLENNLNDLATRYGRDIMVVETGYPFTLDWNDNTNNIVGLESQLLPGYPATVQGQYDFLNDVISIIKNTNADKGAGIMYWSPEWIAAPGYGSPWENVALFDFDNEVLESIRVFQEDNSMNELPGELEKLSISPNPFRDQFTVEFLLREPADIRYEIINLSGKTVKQSASSSYAPGSHQISLRIPGGAAGLYLMKLEINDQPVSLRILKED